MVGYNSIVQYSKVEKAWCNIVSCGYSMVVSMNSGGPLKRGFGLPLTGLGLIFGMFSSDPSKDIFGCF